MFHRRSDRRKRTNPSSISSLHEVKDSCKEGVSPDDRSDSPSSSILCKTVLPHGSTKTEDESISYIPKGQIMNIDNNVNTNDSNNMKNENEDEVLGTVDGIAGHQGNILQQGQGKPSQSIGGAPNLFSFSGIRSLFFGMMKLGSSGRNTPVNQGLAMLAGCTAVSVLITVGFLNYVLDSY